MSAIVALSVNKKAYLEDEKPGVDFKSKFVNDLFWITFYHQHMGQEFGGLATLSGNKQEPILVRIHSSLFREKFEKEKDNYGFIPPLGLGHISAGFPEPYVVKKSIFPQFAICFAGNLINKSEIIRDLINQGQSFERIHDVVLISKLIVQAGWNTKVTNFDNFVNGLNFMSEKIEGAFALAILTEKEIYVARGLDGHEPITIGTKKGAVVAVSESNSLYNQGFKSFMELSPGQVISLDPQADSFRQGGFLETKNKIFAQVCSFKWVYTSDPAAVINGLSAKEARMRLGARHAQRDIEKGFIPHFILPVPDSGRFHALGYKRQFDFEVNQGSISRTPYYDENLLKFSFSSRSYTPALQLIRDTEADKKIIPIFESIKIIEVSENCMRILISGVPFDLILQNQEYVLLINVVLCDDSIVRGTQTVNNLIPKLKTVFEEPFSQIGSSLNIDKPIKSDLRIHLRIGNPKLVSTCPWGKSNKEKENLAAVDGETGRVRTTKEIAERLGVASCYFNTVEDVANAIGMPLEKLCVDCGIKK